MAGLTKTGYLTVRVRQSCAKAMVVIFHCAKETRDTTKLRRMASLNPPIADELSRISLQRNAVILGFYSATGEREVLLAHRDGMHIDVSKTEQLEMEFVYV